MNWIIRTKFNDTANWDVFDQFLFKSRDQFAISHATNTALIFLASITLLGNVNYWLVYALNKLEKKAREIDNSFLISICGWFKNLMFTNVILKAIIKIIGWELFESLLSGVSQTIVFYYPSIKNRTDLVSRIISELWFLDAPWNSVFDVFDGLIAIVFSVYFIWESALIFWRPRPLISWWVRFFVILTITSLIQCLPMIYIQIDPNFPIFSDIGDLFTGSYRVNFVWIGLIGYMIGMSLVYTIFCIEDCYLWPQNRERIIRLYLKFIGFVVWNCLWCLFPIFGIYPQLVMGRITFIIILYFTHYPYDRNDFKHISTQFDDFGDEEELLIMMEYGGTEVRGDIDIKKMV